MRKVAAFALSALLSFTAHGFTGAAVVDFSNGTGGWQIRAPDNDPESGWRTWIDATAGVGGSPAFHSVMPEIWDATWANNSAAVTGDFTKAASVNFSFDLYTESFVFLQTGEEVLRDVVVELRSAKSDGSFVSAFFNVGVTGADRGWQHFSASIADTSSTAVPAGWSVFSTDYDEALPPGMTFSDVLKNVTELRITTSVPGYFYGFSYVDIKIDNIAVTAVPEPSTWASLAAGLALIVARRRPAKR